MTLTIQTRFLLSFIGTAIISIAIFVLSSATQSISLISFFCDDLPPLTGILRILLYTGVLALALCSPISRPPFGDSFIQADKLYKFTLPTFRSVEGAMQVIGGRWIMDKSNKRATLGQSTIQYRSIRLLRQLVMFSWICCIIGFGGRFPSAVVGIGCLLLHGIVSGLIGTSHRWYVPAYSFVCCIFADMNAEWSVDALIGRHWKGYPFQPVDQSIDHATDSEYWSSWQPLLLSGFARKLILIASISTLVFGGVTKILNGGVSWLNGKSLAYYVSSEENGRWPTLKKLMSDNAFMSFALSVGSILLECGSILAIFNEPINQSISDWLLNELGISANLSNVRSIIIVSAALFHFGIWLTMWPNYFPQTWCYFFGMKWWFENNPVPIAHSIVYASLPRHPIDQSIYQSITMYDILYSKFTASFLYPLSIPPVHTLEWPAYLFTPTFLACWIALCTCIFLSFVTAFRIEYWPLTGIPMYSFYRDCSFSYRFLRDEQQAQSVAIEHVESGYPNALAWSNLWIILRLKNTDPNVNDSIDLVRQRRLSRASGDHSVRGDDQEEKWYVNLKSRVTPDQDTHPRYGVLTKQWRRALHNIAATDMAAKPKGCIRARDGKISRIDAESGTSGDELDEDELNEAKADADQASDQMSNRNMKEALDTSWMRRNNKTGSSSSPVSRKRQIYPAENWLLENRDSLRDYARQCDWQLPSWAETTGELQLRVKLKHGYAVLGRAPWNPAQSDESPAAPIQALSY